MDALAWELFDPSLAPCGEDLRPFLCEALDRSSRWFAADSASAFLARGGGEYILEAQAGDMCLPLGTTLRRGVAQAAIDAREPLLVGDPTEHPRLKDAHPERRSDVASSLVLPLILPDGEAIGVINLARCAGAIPYGNEDLEQARHMAGHFAMALGLAIRTVDAARLARREADTRHLAEVGRMTAILAHEIRNPLAAIRAAAQFASECPEYLSIVIEESDRLDSLCEGFLDLARPLDIRLRPTDLAQLLQNLAARERGVFRSEQVGLTVCAGATEKIQVDPFRVELACRNLLKNAREAAGSGGNVALRVWHNGFEVSDDGPGVPNEIRESLFTPFVTAKPRGTGLGLTVVRRVAEAHGGKVTVENREKGAAFRVEFGVAA